MPEALVPLEPGDILYIDGNPADPTQPTHTITCLGQYGVDAATGKMVPLVIDAMGITPPYIDSNNHVGPEGVQIRSPEEIAERLGGIAVKSLGELIRNSGLETTTLGFAKPSRQGGPRRRLWGMTGTQLDALMALRRRGRHG
ncbi:MAG TPA: hypothetical protein VKF17_01405 [Isosphaeraceae bacterium]|nr:hypothetical protein [Isosphaeraceae bacterium]